MLYCFIDTIVFVHEHWAMNNDNEHWTNPHAFYPKAFAMVLYWIDKSKLVREKTHVKVVLSVVRHSDNDKIKS